MQKDNTAAMQIANSLTLCGPTYGSGFEGLKNRAQPGAFRTWYGKYAVLDVIGSAADAK